MAPCPTRSSPPLRSPRSTRCTAPAGRRRSRRWRMAPNRSRALTSSPAPETSMSRSPSARCSVRSAWTGSRVRPRSSCSPTRRRAPTSSPPTSPRSWSMIPSRGVLVTDSAGLATRVEEELADLVRGLERAAIIREATCCVVVARDMAEAVRVVDEFAPEHLLVVAEDADGIAARVRNAGAIFVGPYATVPLGDYTAGPNHTLPTSGAARYSSPLGVHTFLKRTSVLSLGREDLVELREATVRLAALEGLGAHAHAVEVRLE